MSLSDEHEQVLMSLRAEYQLILRWFMFIQGARLIVILAFLSAQGLLFNGLYAVIKYIQTSSHHPIESFLFVMIPMVALVFTYGTRRLLDIITKGILHVIERGIQVEMRLGLPNALFARALHEYNKRTEHKMPPETVENLVEVAYVIITIVWGLVLYTSILATVL